MESLVHAMLSNALVATGLALVPMLGAVRPVSGTGSQPLAGRSAQTGDAAGGAIRFAAGVLLGVDLAIAADWIRCRHPTLTSPTRGRDYQESTSCSRVRSESPSGRGSSGSPPLGGGCGGELDRTPVNRLDARQTRSPSRQGELGRS